MSVNIKKFDAHNQYEQYMAGENVILPNVSYCVDNNETHFNPNNKIDGHEYVDLGLPSGTLWATMNVGADSVTDYGYYFAWGEDSGYTLSQVGTDKNFDWTDYKFGDGGTPTPEMTKYNSNDGKIILESSDDSATVYMGNRWHMPTREQFKEMSDNTTNEWITNYKGIEGLNGFLFTSIRGNGNELFFPAAGFCNEGSNNRKGENGVFWLCSVFDEQTDRRGAWIITCDEYGAFLAQQYRYYGFSVRGVVG